MNHPPPSHDNQPLVAILMATYQGERYLQDQLDSFARQTHRNWQLWASDDGSTDETLALLQRCQEQWGQEKVHILRGPTQGSSRNFVGLTHNQAIQADYYAYSDQDDIWDDDKLERALDWLHTQAKDRPALYCTRTRLVDAQNREIGFSPDYRRPPSFANALMQNIASGNTMVFNSAARQIACAVSPDTEIVIHDWWMYLSVAACGGALRFDRKPSVRYRQHGANLIGMNPGGSPLVSRVIKVLGKTLKRNNEIHLNALMLLTPHITDENRRTLTLFSQARRRWLLPRIAGLRRAGVYRLTLSENFGLAAAAILKRL